MAKSATALKKKPAVDPVPKGIATVTPQIAVSNARAAQALYVKALGGTLLHSMEIPGTGKVMHSAVQIGNTMIFVMDESEWMKAPKNGVGGAKFYVYVKDVDAAHKTAVKAGMKEISAPDTMFWGDRMCSLADPFGHQWDLASHVRDVGEKEMAEAMKEFAKV